jgi:CheY-like chemotaxis protein
VRRDALRRAAAACGHRAAQTIDVRPTGGSHPELRSIYIVTNAIASSLLIVPEARKDSGHFRNVILPSVGSFAESAKHLARNPLGIIALFIVLIYGFASLLVGFSSRLQVSEHLPVIWFLVVFPVLVLVVFAWLVSRHHAKLYSPTDYRQDASFIEASVQQVEVAAALGAATARKLNVEGLTEQAASETRSAVGRVAKFITHSTLQSAQARRVLWVDDQHENNSFEREALQALGFNVLSAHSTEDALKILKSDPPVDVIISDMSRPPDSRAGFTLLNRLRAQGAEIPYVIYSGTVTPTQQAEAWRQGALGFTNWPDDLVILVLEAVSTPKVRAA